MSGDGLGIFRWTKRDYSLAQRFDAYIDVLCEQLIHVSISSSRRAGFFAEIVSTQMGGLRSALSAPVVGKRINAASGQGGALAAGLSQLTPERAVTAPPHSDVLTDHAGALLMLVLALAAGCVGLRRASNLFMETRTSGLLIASGNAVTSGS